MNNALILASSDEKYPCLIVGDPSSISEVFIRRHISFLNNGENLVLSTQVNKYRHLHKNTYFFSRNLIIKLFFRLRLRFSMLSFLDRAILNTGMSSDVFSFSKYFLFEFGALAVDHYELALFGRIPYFIYFRGYDASAMLKDARYVKMLARIVEKAAAVFSVSPHLLSNLEERGILAHSSYVIPSSVEEKAFISPSAKDPCLFVSVGRMVEKKGHEYTIRAFRDFLASAYVHKPRLILIGDGPLLAYIQSLVFRLGISDFVEFKGAIDNALVLKLLEKTTFYVQSSIPASNGDCEGFPSAIQEAMMHSCVIFASKHGGVTYYLRHGENAMISPEKSPRDMAMHFTQLFRNQELIRKMARCAHATAFHTMNISKNIEKLQLAIEKSL